MKLLFIAADLVAGGAERQWQRMITGLIQAGHEARVVALSGGGPVADALAEAGVPLNVVGVQSRYDLAHILTVPEFRSFDADVIVSQDTSAMCVATALGRLRRIPHIHTDHRQVGLQVAPRREALTRLNARWIDRIVVVSQRQSAMWEGYGVPASRISVIHNGVDAPRPGDRAALRAELGIPADTVVAMMTATLRPEKRVGDFIDAISVVRAREAGVIGVVAGGGEQLELARSRAGDDPGLRILGHRDDVSRLLGVADLFVLPSAMEAQPLAILEAMASGLPIIATDVGDIPELATDANGRRVPVSDVPALAGAIAELAGDTALRASCAEASRQLWEQDWQAEGMVARYEQLFTQTAGLVLT